MKSGQLFWGFLFVTIGALILLAKFDIIFFEWDFIWNLWPVLLVLWGILIIIKRSAMRPVVAVIFGIVTGMMVYGFFSHTILHNFDLDRSYYIKERNIEEDDDKETYNVTYNSEIKKAVLDMEVGAGTFIIRRTSHDLLTGYARGEFTDYKFTTVNKNNVAYLNFSQKSNKYNPFDDDIKNRLDIRLNDNPLWDINIKIGAARALFELDDFAIENLTLKTGATDIDLKLGDKAERSRIDIEMGAANLKIKIPKDAGCKISGNMALMDKHFDGFEKSLNGIYLTDNFDEAEKKIYLEIKGAVASIRVDKY